MLINFKVSNSRSILNELELSLISTNSSSESQDCEINLKKFNVNLLKTIALLGANASGKSNILKALADACMLVRGIAIDKVFHYYKNSDNNDNIRGGGAINYSFDVFILGNRYNYIISHDENHIIQEKLFLWKNNQKSELIYSRERINDKYVWRPKEFFKDKNIDFFYKSTPSNKLFLTVANGDINTDIIQKNSVLESIYEWFKEQINIHISLNRPGITDYDDLVTFILKSDENKKLILKLIEIADIPIKDIIVFEIAEIEVATSKLTYRYTKPNGNQVYIQIMTTHHTGENVPEFDFFGEESHGTQQFLAWIGAWLLKLQEGKQPKVFIVDELGTSLHPLLTQVLVKLFYSKKINPHNSQLIFTTHEVKLMDKAIMHPDQLYFVNKINNISSLIRASDFKDIDKYNRLDNLYMHKGLSGVPNIGNSLIIDQILSE